jgi:hypothetical protein
VPLYGLIPNTADAIVAWTTSSAVFRFRGHDFFNLGAGLRVLMSTFWFAGRWPLIAACGHVPALHAGIPTHSIRWARR